MTATLAHIPVLGEEVVKCVVKKPSGIYIDATFGGGGHSRMILDVLDKDGKLIAFDIDDDAVERGKWLEEKDSRFKIVKCNFADIHEYLEREGIEKVDGMVFDLGLSTHQLLSEKRGFSFRYEDAFLDMRMNKSNVISAADVLNHSSREKLSRIFKQFGNINNPSRLINNISQFRKQYGAISTAKDFLDIIEESWDKKVDLEKFVRKCFQAIRIEVNKELFYLEMALDSLYKTVKQHGIVAIITFHSLEDEKIRQWKKKFCDSIAVHDYGENVVNQFSLINQGCIFPSSFEKAENWASRSAKLWAFQKN